MGYAGEDLAELDTHVNNKLYTTGALIKCVDSVKYLGVNLDNKWKF